MVCRLCPHFDLNVDYEIQLSFTEIVAVMVYLLLQSLRHTDRHRKFSNFELEADILSIDTILPN